MPADRAAGEPDAPVEVLRRWQDSGGLWRVVGRTATSVEIVLLTCTGGEEMGRLDSSDPALLALVGNRRSSEDPGPADLGSDNMD